MDVLRTSTYWCDLKGIIDYFDDVLAEDVALRFLDALDASVQFIMDFPDLGSPWESSRPRQSGIRYRLVTGFQNYVILYRRDGDTVHLLRVLHGSQNIKELLGN